MDIELEADAEVLLGHLNEEQRQSIQRLDVAFAGLLAQHQMDPTEVEALADVVILLYDEGTVAAGLDRDTGLESPAWR